MKREVFWDRLRALGWEEGRNLVVERRYARGQTEAFPGFMDEMVQRKVDIIVTASTPGALAAKRASDKIPIVVHYMSDPVGTGLASSLTHPGGNLTGMSYAGWRGHLREMARTVAGDGPKTIHRCDPFPLG